MSFLTQGASAPSICHLSSVICHARALERGRLDTLRLLRILSSLWQ
jgi:hypothetical protein